MHTDVTKLLQEVPDAHICLLLEYMYCGTISVEHQLLSEIMKTAATLQIRGFTPELSARVDHHEDVVSESLVKKTKSRTGSLKIQGKLRKRLVFHALINFKITISCNIL